MHTLHTHTTHTHLFVECRCVTPVHVRVCTLRWLIYYVLVCCFFIVFLMCENVCCYLKSEREAAEEAKKKHFLFYWESKVSATTMNSTFCCFICKQRISLCFFLSCIWRVNSLLVDLLYSRNKNNFSRTSKRAYTQSYIWTITKEVKYKKKSALLYSNGTYCTRSLYSFFSLLFFFLIFYAVFFIFCVCISVCDS